MHWIDAKFKELEEVGSAQGESTNKAARDYKARLAVVSKAWDNLTAVMKADIEQYNAHPSAKRRVGIKVMQQPKLIEVYWEGETRVLTAR